MEGHSPCLPTATGPLGLQAPLLLRNKKGPGCVPIQVASGFLFLAMKTDAGVGGTRDAVSSANGGWRALTTEK